MTLLTLTMPFKVKPIVSYVTLKLKTLSGTRLASLQLPTSHSQHLNNGKLLDTGRSQNFCLNIFLIRRILSEIIACNTLNVPLCIICI